jgi:hypothetical protein
VAAGTLEQKRVTPYRAPMPAARDLIRWPDTFGTRFMVQVDVEEEFDWSRPLDPANRSTEAIRALPGAHRRFAERGVPLTLFVDHPVATDPRAVDLIGTAVAGTPSAIGAQLHAWVTPPLRPLGFGDSYAGNLPPGEEAAKIDTLTEAITRGFGTAPLIFRSGRYGIGPATIALLAQRGYRIDSSVRAHYDYRDDGGPDFRDVGSAAYRVGGLVELPFTTVFDGRLRRRGAALYDTIGKVPHARGVFARAGLLQRVSLTPEDMPIADALRAVDGALADGLRLLVFSFHSPSLEPGHTPYVRNADDLARFWDWWAAMLDRLAALGVTPVGLAEVIAASGA